MLTWPWVIGWLIVAATLCVVVGGVAALLGDRRRRIAHRMLAFGYNTITRFHPRYRKSITGLEHLPAGPCVLCPNHQSYSDVVYLFSLPLHFRWVIKKELFYVPLFGAAMRVAGYPQVDRGNPASARELVSTVGAILSSGVPVLTFPEGSRSADGEVGRFQSGAARLAVMNQVPLVPIGVVGTGRLLPRGSAMYPADAHLAIHVGPPIPTTGLAAADVRSLTRTLRAAVIDAKRGAQGVVDTAAQ